MPRITEIRDPIHGFITLEPWEKDIIDHPVFQRLRRIRQLGLTDLVYPGALHTRFEHSLGVMQIATRMFDQICSKRKEFLKTELHFTDGGLERDRTLVRLAALLHDVGHAPFSHASEELMAENPRSGKPYKHEHYSAAAITHLMTDVIDQHADAQNSRIRAQEIADFLTGESLGRSTLWRDLITGQIDADRADYLLRDSYHIGVAYGHYDLDRLIATLTVAIDPETSSPVIAVEEGGLHAAEALIIARYMMFTQVYFQHTRRAYDFHGTQAIKCLLEKGRDSNNIDGESVFSPPTSKPNLEKYLEWDDWRVLGEIQAGRAGGHGESILKRNHFRRVYQTPELPSQKDRRTFEAVQAELADDVGFIDSAANSWYKLDSDIPILFNPGTTDESLKPLSLQSPVVKGIKAIERTRIYFPKEKFPQAKAKVNEILSREEHVS